MEGVTDVCCVLKVAFLVDLVVDFSTGEAPKVNPVGMDVDWCVRLVDRDCSLRSDIPSEVKVERVDDVVASWTSEEELIATETVGMLW